MGKLEKKMRREPTDNEEEERARSICEQCWLGPLCLLFWVLVIVGFIHGCARGGEVKIAWDANNADQQVTDYRVWRGIECIATVQSNTATVTLPDEPVTLTLTARNVNGESAHSAPMHVVAITVQESPDLKAWGATRTIHREKKPSMFYRLKIQTP